MFTADDKQLSEQLRSKALDAARMYRASWIQLGQFLYSIHKDKMYKDWGYQTFEGYCRNELHLKQSTAMKLLRSYNYLEREEPQIVADHDNQTLDTKKTPNYEAVDVLRLAKQNKALTAHDMERVRESVIEKGYEPKEVRAQVKQMIEENDTTSPDEIRRMKRETAVKRLLVTLAGCRRQFQAEQYVPGELITQMVELIEKLQDQLND